MKSIQIIWARLSGLTQFIICRVRVGRARVERLPCAGRVCALEKTLRCYAEKKTDTVVVLLLDTPLILWEKHTTSTIFILGKLDLGLGMEKVGLLLREASVYKK